MLNAWCTCGARLSIADTDGQCLTCRELGPLVIPEETCPFVLADGKRCNKPRHVTHTGKLDKYCTGHKQIVDHQYYELHRARNRELSHARYWRGKAAA